MDEKEVKMDNDFLVSTIKQFQYYKSLGEKTFAQLPDECLFRQYNAESNSIATIVKHLAGNMRSRWTDFLTSDGEKPDRHRETEFENDLNTRDEMLVLWNNGWQILLDTLKSLAPGDLGRIVMIRNQAHTVMEAVNRQLAHYPYHIDQIVYIGKMFASQWSSLSIPRGDSNAYNTEMFAVPPHRGHFTDE